MMVIMTRMTMFEARSWSIIEAEYETVLLMGVGRIPGNSYDSDAFVCVFSMEQIGKQRNVRVDAIGCVEFFRVPVYVVVISE